MKDRTRWALAGILMVAVAAAAGAQEAPVSAPPAEASGVRLAYKFRPGAVFRYRHSTYGTLIIDLAKAGIPTGLGLPSAVSFDVTSQHDVIHKIKSVAADGTATIAVQFDNLATDFRAEGLRVSARLKNGRLTVTVDGERQGQPGKLFGRQIFEARVAPSGQIVALKDSGGQGTRRKASGEGLPSVLIFAFTMPALEVLVLPAEAIQMGQTWQEPESQLKQAVLEGDEPAPNVENKILNTLREIQKKGTRQIAVIETRVESVVAPDQAVVVDGTQRVGDRGGASITGTHLFDLTSGELRMGDYKITLGMQSGTGGGSGRMSGGSVGLDGTLRTTVVLQPSTPAKPAAARRPARKAPRRR